MSVCGLRFRLEQRDQVWTEAGEAKGPLGGARDMAFAAFDAGGGLDILGFGSLGETVIDVAGEDDTITYLGERSDQRIVAVGHATIAGRRDATIVRLHSDGTIDGTFGSGGVVTHDLGGFDDSLASMAVLPDDSVVAVERRGAADGVDSDFVVTKLDPNGALDPLFGSAGVARTYNAVMRHEAVRRAARSARLWRYGFGSLARSASPPCKPGG